MTQEMDQHKEVLVIGRGVYALPLLRILGTASDKEESIVKITLATSVGWKDVAAVSGYVNQVLAVPRPDRDLEGFTAAICGFAKGKPNLVILPVGEETLFISLPKVANRIAKASSDPNNPPRILTSSCEKLMALHDKFQFQKLMAKLFGEEKIPKTVLVHTHKDLVNAVGQCFQEDGAASRVVIKPLSGHGSVGAHMISRENYESLSSQELLRQYPVPVQGDRSLSIPYVAQEFVEGHEYSTLSLSVDGQVVAHVCYKPRHVGTDGFSPIRDLAPPCVWKVTLDYAQTVATSLQLTGHFGLDMIQRFNGEMAALECNPRVTNGLAFFSPRFSPAIAAQMKAAYLGSWENPVTPNNEVISPADDFGNAKNRPGSTATAPAPKHIMTTLATASCLAKAANSSERFALLEVAVISHDDVWWVHDPLPFVIMVLRFFFAILYAILHSHIFQSLTEPACFQRLKVSDYVKQQIVEEVVSFDTPSEASTCSTKVEVVGGFQGQGTPAVEIGKDKGLRVLVTGATGFLGGRVVRALNQGWDSKTIPLPVAVKSVTAVTATGRNKEKGQQLIESLDGSAGVKTQFKVADLSCTQETYTLVKGHDVVIHCAALCVLWTRWDDYIAANVTATENIAHACHLAGVKLLVHISTPSLCIPIDSDDRLGVKETDPLPEDRKQANRYSATKRMAESVVQDVSKRFNLPSIILRPRAIFGPGDTTLFPLLLDRLKSGKLVIVGRGQETFGDFTYVDNVVAACLCCLDKAPSSPKIYTITNDDPRRLWDIIYLLCDRMKLNHPCKRVPRSVAYTAATLMEGFSALAMLAGYKKDPMFTRYTVNIVSRSCTFDISAAKKDLGYTPVVSFNVGCDRFLDSLDST
jgi:2-alkyl-3-oxoalkanoate reductase